MISKHNFWEKEVKSIQKLVFSWKGNARKKYFSPIVKSLKVLHKSLQWMLTPSHQMKQYMYSTSLKSIINGNNFEDKSSKKSY